MTRLLRFAFDRLPVRGALVQLGRDWQELLRRRAASGVPPAPVRSLLGEMTAAAVLLQSSLRFDGTLALQIFGGGPVKLAVAEVARDLGFRATASVRGEVARGDGLAAMLDANGQGRCAITLLPADPGSARQPYQGIVALRGEGGEPRLARLLERYMLQSEQIPTRLVLAADDSVAAGLLLQRMPAEGGHALGEARQRDPERDDDFERLSLLAATLGADELLSLDAQTLLRRLFWEEHLTPFAPQAAEPVPHFACRCSRLRVAGMLQGLGADEVGAIVTERGEVEVGCEFCGLKYRFDAVDVGVMFAPGLVRPPGSAALN